MDESINHNHNMSVDYDLIIMILMIEYIVNKLNGITRHFGNFQKYLL